MLSATHDRIIYPTQQEIGTAEQVGIHHLPRGTPPYIVGSRRVPPGHDPGDDPTSFGPIEMINKKEITTMPTVTIDKIAELEKYKTQERALGHAERALWDAMGAIALPGKKRKDTRHQNYRVAERVLRQAVNLVEIVNDLHEQAGEELME